MLLAPVGYTFNTFDGITSPPAGFGDYGACAAIIERARVSLSSPQRQRYTWGPIPLRSWIAEPAGDISLRYSSSYDYANGLLNVCRWDFRPPRQLVTEGFAGDNGFALPRNAACTFQVGGFVNQPASEVVAVPVEPPNPLIIYQVPDRLPLHLAFHEEGAGHGGSRQFPWNAHGRIKQGEILSTSQDEHPFPPADNLGVKNAPAATTVLWPSESTLSFQDFKAQEAALAGYNVVSGFSAHIDQTTYDDAIQDDGNAVVSSWAPGNPVAPLSLRVPCRARSDWGSQEWWWREGAPLALVCPDLTPALVYRLPEPIVLHPGDELEPRLEIPGAQLVNPISGDEGISIFQVGLSFTGYAAVKGV